ncbi:unnamed protein product [Onchocerca ochengi]|uniref:Uncharacterized protein n=1 Tax=Onchocerca ochengi TaxID=42157 RepID=A0A182EBG0_ONCOC|nr:unnamed protein product [Onchocerca ochengi]
MRGRQRASWVESLDNNGDHMAQQMKPRATDSKEFQAVTLQDESFDDTSNVYEIRSSTISSQQPKFPMFEKTISSFVPDTQTIRERIRQKITEEIKAKRGSIQRNKRLERQQRNKLLKEGSSTSYSEINQEELDRQIEHSLKLGEKCIADRVQYLPPDDIQYEFMTAQFKNDQEIEIEKKEIPKVVFMAAQPQPPEEIEQFEKLCCTYNDRFDRIMSSSIESAIQNIPSSKLQNYALLRQRVGEHFVNDAGILLGTNLDIDKIPKRPERSDDSCRQLYQYVKAEKWEKALSGIKQQDFIQLDIDLNRIVFNYHWLFGQEDLLCSTIQNLHKMQSIRMQEALKLLKEIETEEEGLRKGKILQQNEKEKLKIFHF